MGEMKLSDIGYMTEPIDNYKRDIDSASTLADLKRVLQAWDALAHDAKQIVNGMSDADFAAWRKALKLERKGKFSGEVRFLPILMPDVMCAASMAADQFKVPWGLAYIWLRDVGQIVESAGRAALAERK